MSVVNRDDPTSALDVVRHGLRAVPFDQRLHRHRFRAYHRLGHRQALHTAMHELRAAVGADPATDDALDDETVTLYRALTEPGPDR